MIKKEVKKLMDKGFLLSIGLASIGKQKAEKLIKELVKKGKLNEQQGRKLVMDLVKKSKIEKEKIKSKFRRIRIVKKTKKKR